MIFLSYSCLAVLALLLPSPAACLDPEQEELIQQFIEEFLSCSQIPGLSLGVVKDGVTELATGYGKTVLTYIAKI